MTMFGLKEADVAHLVRAVSNGEPDRRTIERRFARAAWTGIAEPGDRMAGMFISGVGPVAALTAIYEGWGAEKVLRMLGAGMWTGEEVAQALQRWSPRAVPEVAVTSLRLAGRLGVHLLEPEEDWPGGLIDLQEHAPIALWVRGQRRAVHALGRSIALVGARAATGYGEHVTMEASAGLVDRGYAIVSGAAYGIDGMAHRAALASSGMTIAILAGGVDRFYPSGHDALLGRIVEHGAVISELPCGAAPTKWRFLQRNRLIAAASLATVVLEAGWRSGSLNTAGHALQLGRPLGSVPGPVTSSTSAGCHRLLREYGATCVTTADEMAELAPLADREVSPVPQPDPGPGSSVATSVPGDRARVIDALSTRSQRAPHDIAARSGLSVAAVRSQLGALELADSAHEAEGGWLFVPPKAAPTGLPLIPRATTDARQHGGTRLP